MEEAFPIKFCKGVRSYWRRRKHQKPKGNKLTVARLGGGPGPTHRPRFWKFRSVRFSIPSPVGPLRRLRDAYINTMLGLPSSALSKSSAGEEGATSLVARRIPRAESRTVRSSRRGDFEDRLIMEIYKSVMANSNNLSLG